MTRQLRPAVVTLIVGASAWALTGPLARALPAPPLLAPARWRVWLHTADPVTALVTLLRLASVALTGWLALGLVAVAVMGTVVEGPGTLRRSMRALRATARALNAVVPPPVLAAAALMLGFASAGCARSPSAGGAAASGRGAGTPPTVTMRVVPVAPGTAVPALPHQPPPGRTPTTWVVSRGQSMWSVAAEVAGSRGATSDQVARYWVALVRDNPRPDPDLIRPGEVLELPAYRE